MWHPRGLPRCDCRLAPGTHLSVSAVQGWRNRSEQNTNSLRIMSYGAWAPKRLGAKRATQAMYLQVLTGVRTATDLTCAGAVCHQCGALPRNPAQGSKRAAGGDRLLRAGPSSSPYPHPPSAADRRCSTLPAIAPFRRIRLLCPARCAHSAHTECGAAQATLGHRHRPRPRAETQIRPIPQLPEPRPGHL